MALRNVLSNQSVKEINNKYFSEFNEEDRKVLSFIKGRVFDL